MKSSRIAWPIILVCVAFLPMTAQADLPASSAQSPVPPCKQGFHRNFDDAEKWSKKFDDPARDKWQKPDEVIKALKIGPTDKIADIGAGTGYFSLRIAETYPAATVYAADVAPGMVEYLKRQTAKKSLANHKPVTIPADKPELPGLVDVVLIVDTYHHIDDRITYFEALRKQLLPNGRVAIIDFTAESPEGPPAEYRMSKDRVQDEMRKAGYALDQDMQLLPYQYFLIFKPANGGSRL